MESAPPTSPAAPPHRPEARFPAIESPFIRAPEGARTIFLVTLGAACVPLAAGLVFFGWRAAVVAAISVSACATIERLFYRVTRTPALLGRSHAYLTGVLLALTLPPFVPWYVPLLAAAFAIIVGKAVFGGVGHFVWQPALVGLLAVTVLLPEEMNPKRWPILSAANVVVGDLDESRMADDYVRWREVRLPPGVDAMSVRTPTQRLAGLTDREKPDYSALSQTAAFPRAKPALLGDLPQISDLLFGAYPGGIGETCSVAIVLAGLYLIYRNYVKWQLPVAFLAAAWCVLAVAPLVFQAPNQTTRTVWWPLAAEGFDVGFTYINCHLLSGGLMLAAFFLATEMTSRPTTAGGQLIFGAGAGALAVLLELYTKVPIPAYMGVLAMNTFTPVIDRLWRPRVFGARHFLRFFRRPG